jgi:hypothetical protein
MQTIITRATTPNAIRAGKEKLGVSGLGTLKRGAGGQPLRQAALSFYFLTLSSDSRCASNDFSCALLECSRACRESSWPVW